MTHARPVTHPPHPSLRLSAAPDGKVRVLADARKLADLAAWSIVALGLRDGEPVSPERAHQIARRADLEKCHAAALKAIARRPLSERALRERLARRATDPAIIDETIGVLAREGLVDDDSLARRIVEHTTASTPAGAPLLESKLARHGVESGAAQRAVLEHMDATPHSALQAARAKAATLPDDLSPPAKARRLYAFLARRGFEEHEATDAVERLVGVLPCPLD